MKISQNKSGKWYIDFTCKGRRIRRIVGFSKREADAVVAAIKADILRDQYGFAKQRKQILFEELAEKYYEQHSKINKKSYKTDYFHICRLKHFL